MTMHSLTSRFQWSAGTAVFFALYIFILALPIAAQADTICMSNIDVYSSKNYNSYIGTYAECVPVNFDKTSYTPGSIVTVSGNYPYYVNQGVAYAANSYSLATPSGLAYPANAGGNYSYSFPAPGTVPPSGSSYSVTATANFPGYTDSDSYEYFLHPTGGGCGMTSKDNGCSILKGTWHLNKIIVHDDYTVACSANQVANPDGTCTTPPPPTATITANGTSGSITVSAGTIVHLSAAFSATAPDTLTTTKITDGGPILYGGTSATNPQSGDWTAPQTATSKPFYARAASGNYTENSLGNLAQVTVNVTDQGCTPPATSITANGGSGTVSATVGQPVHLNAAFAAASGDTLTATGIADNQNNWFVKSPTLQGGLAISPMAYDWTPSADGSYIFYGRAATSHCQEDNYAQVIVTAQCPAGQTHQTNGGASGCCPPNQTLQANGTCVLSPNPPTATIIANGTAGNLNVIIGTPVNFHATFAASPGDTLTATGIADYQNGWIVGGDTAVTPRDYSSWSPALAIQYVFYARLYSASFPSPTCFNSNCNYSTVTVTASCPSGQTAQSNGTCACPANYTMQNGQCVANPICPAGTNYQTNGSATGCCATGQTLQTNGTCTTPNSVTASLYVGTYNATTEGYTCNASSATIYPNDSALMCWACTGANVTPTGTGFSTGGVMTDQIVISPSQTTSYSLQCASPSGSASAQATVYVVPRTAPASSVTFSANPTLVRKNETTKLTWTSTNTSSCTLSDNLPGHSPLSYALNNSGFTTAAITARTVFTLSCVGTDGNHPSSSVTVNIAPSFKEF